MHTQEYWTHSEYLTKVLNKTLEMIQSARDEYAKTGATTPEFILSQDENFLNLCHALKNPEAWQMLRTRQYRHERQFINRAVDYLPIATQRKLGR